MVLLWFPSSVIIYHLPCYYVYIEIFAFLKMPQIQKPFGATIFEGNVLEWDCPTKTGGFVKRIWFHQQTSTRHLHLLYRTIRFATRILLFSWCPPQLWILLCVTSHNFEPSDAFPLSLGKTQVSSAFPKWFSGLSGSSGFR
jgi:hypothetical protein